MSFQPVVPMSGYVGWMFLQRTLDTQQALHADAAVQKRDTTYFVEKIPSVTSADELIADRRLLKVALGAFGLDDDLNNRFFIKKVLEEGTTQSGAIANRLADKAYFALSKAFGFGDDSLPRTGLSGFSEEIIPAYEDRQFEIAVGEREADFRLALGLQREVSAIAARDLSDDGKWYLVMGSTPMRKVFETAFGLPSSFASLDLDDQLATLRDKANDQFGSREIGQFTNPDKLERLVQTFLLRSELSNGASAMTSGHVALTLLGNARVGEGISNLT